MPLPVLTDLTSIYSSHVKECHFIYLYSTRCGLEQISLNSRNFFRATLPWNFQTFLGPAVPAVPTFCHPVITRLFLANVLSYMNAKSRFLSNLTLRCPMRP